MGDEVQLACYDRSSFFFSNHWRGILSVLVPICGLPIYILGETSEFACMYVLYIMAIYWIFELVPLPVTSLIPTFAFPLLGIMQSDDTCKSYCPDIVVMFIGSMVMALAIEYCNLHKRVALKVIGVVGCSPFKLHWGIICVTTFLSMWLNNAACTSMMCPIIYAILEELQNQGMSKIYREDYKPTSSSDPPYPSKMTICFYLGTAYASSLGGTGTLIGTPTNLVIKGIFEGRFNESTSTIDFPKFMVYTIPPMIIYTIISTICLQVYYMGLFRPNSKEAKAVSVGEEGIKVTEQIVAQKYKELGSMTCHEISVLSLFVILILLFFTKNPTIFYGWGDFLNDHYPGKWDIKNSTPAMLIVLITFMLPINYEWLKCKSSELIEKRGATPSLISWKFIHEKLPWGLMFLIGGGFTLSAGAKASGMALLVGQSLKVLKGLPAPIVLLMSICIAQVMTEISLNVAAANIILPVLNEMSIALEIHPLYLVLPTGIACSMAFHLPVGTAANAIVAGYVNIRTTDMIVAGIGPTLVTTVVIFIAAQTWALVVYPDLLSFPSWAT